MDLRFKNLILIFLVVLVKHFKLTFGSTMSLQIRLESYQNPLRSLADRSCCIKETSTCRIDCSNSFKICISTTSSTVSCDILEKTIGDSTIGDDELFTIGDNGKSFKNPVTIDLPDQFKSSTVHLSIQIYHQRTSLVGSFDAVALTIDGAKASWTSLGHLSTNDRRSRYRKTMSLSVKTSCHVGYIGQFCNQKSCAPRDDDQGHYTCNAQNEIACLPGWIDAKSGCTKKIIISTTNIISSSLKPSTATISTHLSVDLLSSIQQDSTSGSTATVPTTLLAASSTSLLTKSFTSIYTTFMMSSSKTAATKSTTIYIEQQRTPLPPSSTKANSHSSTISNIFTEAVTKTVLVPQVKTVSTFVEYHQTTAILIQPSSASSSMVSSTMVKGSTKKSTVLPLLSSTKINDLTKKSTILTLTSSIIIETFSKKSSIIPLPSSTRIKKFTKETLKSSSASSTNSIDKVSISSIIITEKSKNIHPTGPSTITVAANSTASITTTANPDRPTLLRKTNIMFPLLLGIVLSIALIGWLIVLIYLRKRLIAKARIRSIIQMTGAYQAPSPQECKVTVFETSIYNNDGPHQNQSSLKSSNIPNLVMNQSFVKETTLTKPLPDK